MCRQQRAQSWQGGHDREVWGSGKQAGDGVGMAHQLILPAAPPAAMVLRQFRRLQVPDVDPSLPQGGDDLFGEVVVGTHLLVCAVDAAAVDGAGASGGVVDAGGGAA
ncbi:Uncharacterised protein [Actinomyces bovis]|uniref:Uncharacterized protein n=1 Tax=Actinomyces bovis TaxID=1658 RepID=A0ABY1VNL4_9ACTO|nr:Uncharacterised protein [Actinomyces bovis]VEG55832.1 Uncharacterised protein [Actinomyces israelii]